MQAYTEEQRAELIGLCRIEVRRWKAAAEAVPEKKYMVELMETALAALTAKPVGKAISPSLAAFDVDQDLNVSIYTAPPVAAPAVPDGWKLVPVEPTQEMVDACFEGTSAGGIQKGYRAMLAAAPEHSQ